MDDNTQNTLQKISLIDAVIVAGITAFSYVFHYFFEFGYLSYFELPAALISFNLTELIPTLFLLVFAYFVLAFLLWPYIQYGIQVLPGLIKTILLFSPWIFIISILWPMWEIITIFAITVLIFGIQRLWKSGKSDQKQKNPPFLNHLLFYFLITALASSFALGRITAVTRSSFPFSETEPACAIVYLTSERYICKPLHERIEFGDTYRIFFFQDNQYNDFRNETIGPLNNGSTS